MSGVITIAGIDASTKSSGISLINEERKLLDYKLVQYNDSNADDRIDKMCISLGEILSKWKPTYVFMEDTWNKLNIETSKKLTMIIGAMNYWCLQHNTWFIKLLPSSWRSEIGIPVGKNIKRKESKELAIKYIKDNFNIDVNDDVAESIGLAIAGLNKINNNLFE